MSKMLCANIIYYALNIHLHKFYDFFYNQNYTCTVKIQFEI